MLINLLRILLLIAILSVTTASVGSSLFNKKSPDSDCWKEEEIARLRVRKLFEDLAPVAVPPDKVTEKYLKGANRYLRTAFDTVDLNTSPKTGKLLKQVLADTFGAHLKREILPAVRFAYYAGYVPYREVRNLHDFQEELKSYLDSQGQGWKDPNRVPSWSNITVAKIFIGSGRLLDACANLKVNRDFNSCINLPLPKLDDESEPTALYLPFKYSDLVSLTAPRAENSLLKYYTTASRCILQRSPRSCRHSDFVNFSNDLWFWLKESVAPHLIDEKLYSAYGGVLRVAAAVQSYGKDVSRRDLNTQLVEPKKWYPWSYFRANAVDTDEHNWPPIFYIFIIFLVAGVIFLSQICFNTFCTCQDNCYCTKRSRKNNKPKYSNLDYSSPSCESLQRYNQNEQIVSIAQVQTPVTTTTAQKVYDLNENKEKIMQINLTDDENTGSDTSSARSNDNNSDLERATKLDENFQRRSSSPPKIETPIYQLKVPRSADLDVSSTYTHQLSTCRAQKLEDSWTGTRSDSRSTSATSECSIKWKKHSKRTPRDLEWARKVLTKHRLRLSSRRSETGTDVDATSITATPPNPFLKRSRKLN